MISRFKNSSVKQSINHHKITLIIPLIHMGGLMVFSMVSTSFGTLTILACLLELICCKEIWISSLIGDH